MAARDIFATIAADPQHSYAVRVSFLEIYNEEVRDLLVAADGKSGAAGAGGQRGQQATLAVREDPKAGVFVENLCLLYTSPSPRDKRQSRMPSSA